MFSSERSGPEVVKVRFLDSTPHLSVLYLLPARTKWLKSCRRCQRKSGVSHIREISESNLEASKICAVPQTVTTPQGVRQPECRVFNAPRPLGLWHLASLDAPSVAATWSLAFAKTAGVQLPAWVPLLLALVTWAVYIGDRLLDARLALQTKRTHCLRERHLFEWRHRRTFLLLGLAACCGGAWITYSFMPARARERNSLLAIAATAYFSCVHLQSKLRSLLPKELLVGVLFTAGCAVPTFGRAANISASLIAEFAFFAALAWLNCYAIEFWESVGQIKPSGQIIAASCVLALAGFFGTTILPATQARSAELIGAGVISALLLAFLDCTRRRLAPLALRVAADLVLLTPLVVILR